MTPEERQLHIDMIEGFVGTLLSMPWNLIADIDLLKLSDAVVR